MICQRMPAFSTLPLTYWLSVYALCWVLLWLAIRRPKAHLAISNLVFGIIAVGLFFFLRLPSIVFDHEINPDESQMIAQAMTLRQDPVYFRSVDGTTGGPLDSYLLLVPAFLGLPFDYITAHLMAFGLVGMSLLLLFATARLWFGTEAARLALVPVVVLLGLTQNGDLLHYNSELVAIMLLSATYYLLSILMRQSKPSMGLLISIGLLLGMVPFGKLQGGPLGAVVGLFAALVVALSANISLGQKIARLSALLVSAITFPVLFIVLVWSNGVYDDFVTFYVMANFQYATGSNPVQNLLDLPRFFRKGDEFDWFVKLVLATWLVCLLVVRSRQHWRLAVQSRLALAFLGVLTLTALYAITRTGSEYVHYLYFLIGPLLFWMAYGVAILKARWANGSQFSWLPTGLVAGFILTFLVQASLAYTDGTLINNYPTEYQSGWRMPLSNVAVKVLEYAQPGEKLAVWGWRCDYYVQTQMVQGIAENHTIRSVFDHSLRDVYQRRYISNMTRSLPVVFVDAVGRNDLWLTDRKTQGHEFYPPLGQFIAANYRYVGMVDDSRIYVRNDRVPERRDSTTGRSALLVERKYVDKKRTNL